MPSIGKIEDCHERLNLDEWSEQYRGVDIIKVSRPPKAVLLDRLETLKLLKKSYEEDIERIEKQLGVT